MLSFPSRNKTLAVAAKNYAKTDIKISWPCPILLDFFALPRYFFLRMKKKHQHYCYDSPGTNNKILPKISFVFNSLPFDFNSLPRLVYETFLNFPFHANGTDHFAFFKVL